MIPGADSRRLNDAIYGNISWPHLRELIKMRVAFGQDDMMCYGRYNRQVRICSGFDDLCGIIISTGLSAGEGDVLVSVNALRIRRRSYILLRILSEVKFHFYVHRYYSLSFLSIPVECCLVF